MPRDGQPARAPTPNRSPGAARAEIDRLLASRDLFRYTSEKCAGGAPPERRFAQMMGSRMRSVWPLARPRCFSLKALDLPRGAQVLVPAFTFAAVPSSIVRTVRAGSGRGGREFPHRSGGFPRQVRRQHRRGDDQPACAAIPRISDAIMELADARGVPVIEDAAHSPGDPLAWQEKSARSARSGCFSFQSYKLVNGRRRADHRRPGAGGPRDHHVGRLSITGRSTRAAERLPSLAKQAAAGCTRMQEPVGRGDPPPAAGRGSAPGERRRANHGYVAKS